MRAAVAIALMTCLSGCVEGEGDGTDGNGALRCAAPEVRVAAERLGAAMRRVSLLAPDSTRLREIRAAYAPLVTERLLTRWLDGSEPPPGRETSSPWPDRIDVTSVRERDGGTCLVEGVVVHLAREPGGGTEEVARTPVHLRVIDLDGWCVDGFAADADPGGPAPVDGVAEAERSDVLAAVGVLRRYYAEIDAGRYDEAYVLWSADGAASGQTPQEFAAGFADTRGVELELGVPGRVEGAAGSRYISIPVVIRAGTVAGEAQRFEGTYVLRRSVVDGASVAQRAWRIASADITESVGR